MMDATPRRWSSLATARPESPVPMTTAVVRSIPPYKGMLDTAGYLLEMVRVAGETPDADPCLVPQPQRLLSEIPVSVQQCLEGYLRFPPVDRGGRTLAVFPDSGGFRAPAPAETVPKARDSGPRNGVLTLRKSFRRGRPGAPCRRLECSQLTENSEENQGFLHADSGSPRRWTPGGSTSGRIAATSGKNREEADPMGREQVHPDPAWETGGEPAPPRGIVVGVDGSDHSHCALVWAAREAERRRRPLHIVTAYSVPIFAASGLDGGYATVDDSVIREGAEAILKHAMDKIAFYNIDVDASVENGDASGVLLEISETAELLVFGTRGRGGYVGRLLGSVSSALPAHAKCPTVTVPLICADRLGETTNDKHVLAERAKSAHQPVENVVVAGVDGSEQARVAVLEAAAQAERLSARLRLVCAVPQYTGSLAWVPAPMDREALFADIRVQLDAGVAWLKSHFPTLEVETQLVDGSPVDILVDASRHVELVVLGTRGRGGFTGMLLGSTTDGVLHHAKGPVMVVPDRDDPRLADRASFGPMLGES